MALPSLIAWFASNCYWKGACIDIFKISPSFIAWFASNFYWKGACVGWGGECLGWGCGECVDFFGGGLVGSRGGCQYICIYARVGV